MPVESKQVDTLLCRREIGERLGCRPGTVDFLIREGKIKSANLPDGIRFRYFASSVEECLQSMRGEAVAS